MSDYAPYPVRCKTCNKIRGVSVAPNVTIDCQDCLKCKADALDKLERFLSGWSGRCCMWWASDEDGGEAFDLRNSDWESEHTPKDWIEVTGTTLLEAIEALREEK